MKILTEIGGVLGAILLSIIVTILLTRLSESQFIIKINIVDFWGSLVVGFAANYGGAKVLDKIFPDLASSNENIINNKNLKKNK
jgi:fluoride ion exporter CrcB/FEX